MEVEAPRTSSKRYVFEVLENSPDDELCRLILDIILIYPLETYSQARVLTIDKAIEEILQLIEVLKKFKNISTSSLEAQQHDYYAGIALFILHISKLFARLLVEIYLALVREAEPHTLFWEQKARPNFLGHISLPKLKTKTYYAASRNARVFKKLQQDLLTQSGHTQGWYWGLNEVESFAEGRELDDIIPFIKETRDVFVQSSPQIENDAKPSVWIDLLFEAMEKVEPFCQKFLHDMKVWGKPNHWVRNKFYYITGACAIIIAGSMTYTKWSEIYVYSKLAFSSFHQFFIEHSIEPLKIIIQDLFFSSKRDENVEMLEKEKQNLAEMIKSFESNEIKNLNNMQEIERHANQQDMTLLMDKYKKDIEHPLKNIAFGSLFTNLLIQVQKMKVEMGGLLVQVDKLIEGNRVNLEIITTIPVIIIVWGMTSVISSIINNRRLKKKKMSGLPKQQLRRIFRECHVILVKNMHQSYLLDEDCGILLNLLYKLIQWGKVQYQLGILSNEENNWLNLDIQHFIACEYSVEQRLALLRRMESYYLDI